MTESPHPTQQQRRRLPRWPLFGVGILLVGIAAPIILVNALNTHRTPAVYAERYLAALASGEASEANALTAPSLAEPEGTDLLADQVLAAATEHISNVSVSTVDGSGDNTIRTLQATFTLAGAEHTSTLIMKPGTPEWGVLKTWQVDPSSIQTTRILAEGDPKFTVAGVDINEGVQTVRLYPAVYPVVSIDQEFLTIKPTEIAVSNEARQMYDLTATPTPALESEVQRQVTNWLDECATTTVSYPLTRGSSPCPLQIVLSQRGRVTGTWEIMEYPTVKIWHGGTIVSTSGGLALFTAADGSETGEMWRGIEATGLVEVSDGSVTVTFP